MCRTPCASLPLVALLLALPLRDGGAQTLPDPLSWDRVLSRFAQDGRVDYAALRLDRGELEYFLDQVARTSPVDLDRSPRDDRLAFWINAHNACVVRLVLDAAPSLRQVPAGWSRGSCRVAQASRSPDDLVQRFVRPLGEPRAHFALSQGAVSSPLLAAEAYRGARLDAQLDEAVRRFVTDSARVRVDSGSPPVLWLSPLFEWNLADFGGASGVVAFLTRYLPADAARGLAERAPRVEYLAFDWRLAERAR